MCTLWCCHETGSEAEAGWGGLHYRAQERAQRHTYLQRYIIGTPYLLCRSWVSGTPFFSIFVCCKLNCLDCCWDCRVSCHKCCCLVQSPWPQMRCLTWTEKRRRMLLSSQRGSQVSVNSLLLQIILVMNCHRINHSCDELSPITLPCDELSLY